MASCEILFIYCFIEIIIFLDVILEKIIHVFMSSQTGIQLKIPNVSAQLNYWAASVD